MSSPDHTKLMEILGKDKDLEYVNIQYTKMVPAIRDGLIDITIYNKDTVDKPGIFGGISFQDLEINKELGDETRAVLVVNNESPDISNLLKQIINKKEISIVQNEVIEGKRVPVY